MAHQILTPDESKMNPTTRMQFYKDARAKVERSIASIQPLETPLIMKCLALIKDDVGGSSQATRTAATDMLLLLMGVKSAEVQTEIMKFTQENSGDEVLQRCVINSLRKVVLDRIVGGDDFLKMLQVWLPYKDKISSVIEDICKSHIPPDKCKHLFLNTIVPSMMTEENLDADLRTVLIDLAFRLSCIVPMSSLTSDEADIFLKNIGTRYVVAITKLRDIEYCNWHKLWMFLVRFSGKYLHNSMDLTNKLLRVVEFAFRNVNYLQRLRGYDCWKELIDNASLDKAYISSNKQMKLLITPLKAKFSKQDVVICKRFSVFCYLLDKLQEKAVLCLREFLEFCFGPVSVPADSSKVGPVKSVPTLWLKSARALIDILGHYHDKKDCVIIEQVIHNQKPLVDSTNFSSFCSIILNSVLECCMLLKGVEDATESEKVIKCLWGTVFYLAAVTDNSDCFDYTSQILESIVQKSNDDAYFQKILMLIPSAFVTESKISIKLMEKLMKPMWKVLFNAENIPPSISETFKHCMTKVFANTTTVEEKIKIVKDVMREIVTVQITDKNVQTVNKIWLCLAKEITDEFGVEKLEQFDDFNNFFLWPAYFIHNLEETDKKQTVLLWMKLYRKLAQESDDKKIEIFKDLEKIFKNNPLLATNITSLVNIMSQFDSKRSNDFVCRLLGLVSQVLELPNLKNDDEHKLTNLMLQYLDPTLECYSEQSEHHDVISKMCNCIKHTLCLHQSYKVLEPLGNFLRTSPQNVRIQFSKHLNELLADLYKKQSDAKSYAAKELQKVMVIFEEGDEKGKKVFIVPSGRSARIANLAKKSPKSPKKASPVSLKLFGKDLETLSPLKVKGSQLNNTTPTRKKKAANVIPSKIRTPSSLDDESASKFVAIDSEVKFQPSKLSEHQKEVLKRRRDDIPALYQDLSQSQSQDFCSKSNSNEVSQDQQEVKERRLSRDVAEVIEELNEFVQVRTSFEEEEKDGEEVKQAQNSQDLFGESEAVMQVQKPTEDQPKPMLSESLFSEEITQESAGKSSEIITPKQDDTGNKTTSDMTSLKVEETLSKPSEMSSLEVAETTSKSSGMSSKNLEETSNKTSVNTSPKIEVSSSKSSSTTSKIDEETSNKTSENTSQKTEVSSSKSSSTTSKIDEETSNKTSGNTLQKIEVSSSKSSGMTSKNDEETSNKTSENTSPNIEVSSRKSSGMTSKNDEETVNKTSVNTSLNVEVSSSKTSDMPSKNEEETSNKTSENTSLNVEVSSSKTSDITSLEVGKTATETSEMTSVNEKGDEVKLKEETKEEKKKRKIAAELAKLQMNIVGADEYFASSRRRRAKPKDKDKEEELGKKPGRKSLGAQLDEKTAGNARRKTMESSSSENDTPKRISRKPDQNVTAVKKPKTPPKQTANADGLVVTDSNENVPAPKKDLEQTSGSEVEDVSASVRCEPKTPKSSKKGSNENVSASKKDLEPASVSEVEDVSASVRSEPKTPKSSKKASTDNVSAPKKDLEQAEDEDVSASVRSEPKSLKPSKKGSNENVSAPTKDLEQALVSEVEDASASVRSEPKSPKSSKKRSKNLDVKATVVVSKQQTVPSITDQKNTKTPRKRSKVRDSEVSEVPEQPTTVPLEQKVGKSPKKEGKAKSPLSKVAEQKSSESPRKGARRQHSEPSNTPDPQKVEEKETPLSGQKANDSVRKMTHKRDLSRQLVNIGPQDEPATSIVQKDLKKSPKKIVISNISEQGIVATNSGQDAVDSPKKRVRRIVSEHSYVVKNIEAENIISAITDPSNGKSKQSTLGIEAKSVASTSPECGPEVVVNLQEGQESTVVGNLPESENQVLEDQPSKEHIIPEEEHKQVISDSIGPDFETKIKRKKKHSGVHVTAESEQVIGFEYGEIKVSKKKHKKKHSDHDSSEDGGELLSGLKSPKKKSKKKHSESPEKIEAVKAAELRFKKRLSDLESEIDHCRQFISQTEAKEDDLVIVDNNEMVSPSSENEDNRAIKIRLKRREDSGKKRRSKKDKYEVAQTQEEVGETRKRKLSTEEDCEDVIESSQESYADISSLTNASKRRKVVMTVDTIDEETMVQKVPEDFHHSHSTLTQDKVADVQEIEADLNDQDTTQCTTATDDTTQESLHVEEQQEQVKTVDDTQETLTQITQRTQDTMPDIIAEKMADAKNEGCYFELPQKPDLTESEQIMCRMDTMSVCLNTNPDHRSSLEEIEIRATRTPEKTVRAEEVQTTPSTNSITSSPVTGETPNRTSELLQDTIDISPISQGSTPTTTSTCDSVEISVAKALVFEAKEDHLNEAGNEENLPQCWSFAPPESLTGEDSSPEEARDAETSDETKEPTTIQERSTKFISVALMKSPLSHRRFAKKRGGSAVKMSPSTGRIMRLMSNFNQKPQAEEKGEDNDVREEDLLTFSREVPSPLAVPRSSILKRKLSDLDSDGLSPASKRKRVNFSDPCLTSKKIFIKDEDFQLSAEAKRLFDTEQQVKPSTLAQLFGQGDSNADIGETESEQAESEQALDIASTTMLRKDRPIYPKLMGCEDDVIAILKRVTSPMFVTTLMNKLKDRDIRTIGELAQLSEVEVSRFPFKVPVVANVYKALDNYYHKKMASRQRDAEISKIEHKESDVLTNECSVSTSAITPPRSVRINGFPEKMENESLPSSPTTGEEGIEDDNTKEPIEMAIVNLKQIISQSPMLDKTSKCIIRCLMETIGVSKLIDSVATMCEGDKDRVTLLACLSRMTSDSSLPQMTDDTGGVSSPSHMTSDSVSSYVTAPRVRNLSEIKEIVEGSMDVGEVRREEVIEQCLLPLVQSPKDLYGYIDRVKVVQLGELVIDRLKGEEVDEFLHRIISTYPKQSLQCVAKNCQSTLVTPTQLVNTFQSFLSNRSKEDQKEIMVEMFRYISGKLDPATLLTLHLDFLGGIRQVVESTSRL